MAAFRRAAEAGGRSDGRLVDHGLVSLGVELLLSNLRQWDLEDATRGPLADDATVAHAKRAIDRLNIDRHELVERIDALVDAELDQSPAAPLATEGPGMVFDRLSVQVIRLVRTQAAVGHADRVPILERQIESLAVALEVLLGDVWSGARRFEPYQHLKLYESARRPEGGSRPG